MSLIDNNSIRVWITGVLVVLTAGTAIAQSQNQIVGFGFSPSFWYPSLNTASPTGVSPGGVVALFTAPLGVPDAVTTQTPWPTSLSGVSVSVRVVGANDATGYPASLPILRIDNVSKPTAFPCSASGPPPVVCSYSQVTVQIPVDKVCILYPTLPAALRTCGVASPVFPQMLLLNVKANGVTGPDFLVKVDGSAHLLNSCDTIFGPQGFNGLNGQGICQPLVTHANGSFVTDQSPATVGETISIYAVGGATFYPDSGWPATGYAAAAPVAYFNPNETLGFVTFSYLVSRTLGTSPTGINVVAQTVVQSSWTGLVQGYVGLYQINVVVPAMPTPSTGCIGTFTPGGNAEIVGTYPALGYATITSDAPLYICVQP